MNTTLSASSKKKFATEEVEARSWDGLSVSSAIYIALLFAAFLVSLFNIQELAAQNHAMPAVSWLLAVFVSGTAAITVYVAVIAKTPALRRLATWLGIGFAVVSALLQITMYLTLETPIGAAVGFGIGVPLMEALIAWLEGSISIEREELRDGDSAPARQIEVQAEELRSLHSKLSEATALLKSEKDTHANTAAQLQAAKESMNDLRMQLASLRGEVKGARPQRRSATRKKSGPIVVDWQAVLPGAQIRTATDLCVALPGLKERTAQRRIEQALTDGTIIRDEAEILVCAA